MWGAGLPSARLLRHYRLLAGLTQEELGSRSGYSADYIRKLERGRRGAPRAALGRIAEVLGLADEERDALLADTGQAPDGKSRPRPLVGRAGEIAEIRR